MGKHVRTTDRATNNQIVDFGHTPSGAVARKFRETLQTEYSTDVSPQELRDFFRNSNLGHIKNGSKRTIVENAITKHGDGDFNKGLSSLQEGATEIREDNAKLRQLVL